MKTRTIALPLMLSCGLLFCSCGKQNTAEGLAEDFIEEYALAPEKILYREYADVDSTKRLNDSIILSMQARGHELYKKEIPYPVKTCGRMLYYLRMQYVYEGDTMHNTFYLDENLEQVVSFK